MSKIEKVQNINRGYGSCTIALFKSENSPQNCNGWDYVEIIEGEGVPEYQRGCRCMDKRESASLVGKTVKEIEADERYTILRGKWHYPAISPEGELLSMRC